MIKSFDFTGPFSNVDEMVEISQRESRRKKPFNDNVPQIFYLLFLIWNHINTTSICLCLALGRGKFLICRMKVFQQRCYGFSFSF